MTTATINKFFTLNKMQKSVSKYSRDAWELRVNHMKRSRTVTFIRKDDHGYTVIMTGITYKSFMAALASLIGFYINELWKLVKSNSPLDYKSSDVSEQVAMLLSNAGTWNLEFEPDNSIDMSVPRLPTYDRGPKKEYLHPLRKAVTRWFGGKYSR